MATNPKFVKLLTAIKEATAQGRVTWDETSDEDTFRIILDRGVIRIGKGYDEIDNSAYTVATLADKKGITLDTISTADEPDEETWRLLDSVYSMARKRAKKVDELLDELISEVETRRL